MSNPQYSSGTEGLDQCPVCRSRLVSLYEKQTGLFAVGCDNDDCHFTVEAYGATQADAVRQWNTRDVAQPPSRSPSLMDQLTEWFDELNFDRSHEATRNAEFSEMQRIVRDHTATAQTPIDPHYN